ncbi:MAG: hypothetical protein PHX80_05460 [Candidatus Nanoarchaeia archaeon]|nr:hypothetical protein [Candidatus Nanoarchaeia archaeon]
MNKIAFILIFLVVLAVLVYVFHAPKITIESIDKVNKRAVVKIGNKKFNYLHDKVNRMNIPLKLNYKAEIEPNKGSSNFAIIQLYRGVTRIKSETINFD